MDEPVLARRELLKWAAAASAGLLAGCSISPRHPGWGLTSWAEGVFKGLLTAGPLRNALAKEYPASAITRYFPIRSLNLDEAYAESLEGWTLRVDGLVARPETFTLRELTAQFRRTAHVTRHDCVEGWSAIAEFGGVRVSDVLAAVRPAPGARYVVFHAADFDDGQVPYYGSLDLEQAMHPQAVLAYDMNGRRLALKHGAPLRLRVPNQLGYKSTKFIHRVSLVASLEGLGRGKGGYWEDQGYEHFAGI